MAPVKPSSGNAGSGPDGQGALGGLTAYGEGKKEGGHSHDDLNGDGEGSDLFRGDYSGSKGGSPARKRTRRSSVCTVPAIALPHLESPAHLQAILMKRDALHAVATTSLGRFAENLDYIPGPPEEPEDGSSRGDGVASTDRPGKLQMAHELVSTLDGRASESKGAAGGEKGPFPGDQHSRRRSSSFRREGAPNPNRFRRPVATDRKPLQLPWYDLVVYAAQRMDCRYTRSKLLAYAVRPRCLYLIEECFWFVHLQLFGGLDEKAASGEGGGDSESGLAPYLQQEMVLQRISKLYVSIVRGTKVNRDRLLDHLPFLAAASAFLAYFYCLPGSRQLYTPQLKLRLILVVVRLVTGSDMTPVAVLRLYSKYFPDEIPLPREVTERIVQQFAGLPGAGTEQDDRMRQTGDYVGSSLGGLAETVLQDEPGAPGPRADDQMRTSRKGTGGPSGKPRKESVVDATLRRTKAAIKTRKFIREEAMKAAVDFDTSMTKKEQKLLGYIEVGNVEILRTLPLGDILPQAVKANLLESAQREARQEQQAAEKKKTKEQHRNHAAGGTGNVQPEAEAVDGRAKAAAALLNPAYKPLQLLASYYPQQPSDDQGGAGISAGNGYQQQQQKHQAVGAAAKVPRAQALLVTRTRTKPLTVAFDTRYRSGLVERALAGKKQHSASHAAGQFLRATTKGNKRADTLHHSESAPSFGLDALQRGRDAASVHRHASAVARDTVQSDISSELGSWAGGGGRARNSTIGSYLAVRLTRAGSSSTIGEFEEETRRHELAGKRGGEEATETVTSGTGVGRTVRRYIPLPWEVSGGIETLRVTKNNASKSKQVLSRQQVIRKLARRVVKISDEAQEAISNAAQQVGKDIYGGMVRGVSKFARDVERGLDGREAQKRKERREAAARRSRAGGAGAGGRDGSASASGRAGAATAAGKSKDMARAKKLAEEAKAGIDLESYRMRVEDGSLPERLMQEGSLSAADGKRIKQTVSRAAQLRADNAALRKSKKRTKGKTRARGGRKKKTAGMKAPADTAEEPTSPAQSGRPPLGRYSSHTPAAATNKALARSQRLDKTRASAGSSVARQSRASVGAPASRKRAPVSGAYLLRPDHILNTGSTLATAAAGGGSSRGRGGGSAPSSAGGEPGEAEQRLAALEQTLQSIRATNAPGLDGAPLRTAEDPEPETDEQKARHRAKASRAAAETARMAADGIAPPPRRAGRGDMLPQPSPLLAFHDAADRRAQKQDVSWQIRNGRLVGVRRAAITTSSAEPGRDDGNSDAGSRETGRASK